MRRFGFAQASDGASGRRRRLMLRHLRPRPLENADCRGTSGAAQRCCSTTSHKPYRVEIYLAPSLIAFVCHAALVILRPCVGTELSETDIRRVLKLLKRCGCPKRMFAHSEWTDALFRIRLVYNCGTRTGKNSLSFSRQSPSQSATIGTFQRPRPEQIQNGTSLN